jgi:hypothetical protein
MHPQAPTKSTDPSPTNPINSGGERYIQKANNHEARQKGVHNATIVKEIL